MGYFCETLEESRLLKSPSFALKTAALNTVSTLKFMRLTCGRSSETAVKDNIVLIRMAFYSFEGFKEYHFHFFVNCSGTGVCYGL